jgi:MraZ protein
VETPAHFNHIFMENTTDFHFSGIFEHGMDDKGRVVMPLEFREPLGEEFILTFGIERCLFIFPKPIWDTLEPKFSRPILQRQALILQRQFLASKSLCRLDSQFRLSIPKHLREYAGITERENVFFFGLGCKIEVWSHSVWRELQKTITPDMLYDSAEAVGVSEAIGFKDLGIE